MLLAQEPVAVETQATSVLLAQAREMMEAGESAALLPYLKEILVRLEGNNVVAGKKTLAESGLTLITGDSMADAAQKVVKAVAN